MWNKAILSQLHAYMYALQQTMHKYANKLVMQASGIVQTGYAGWWCIAQA